MRVASLDHLVPTARDLERSCGFYERMLGMEIWGSDDGRLAIHFRQQKIDLHKAGAEFEPKARQPAPRSADL